MLTRMLLIFAFVFAGCDKPVTVNRVARQKSAPIIASDPQLGVYLGDWDGENGLELSINRNADGSATISLPPNQAWDSVVNNVRFDGANLRYDVYMYYKGKEDFKTITNAVGDHPYSGVRNEVTLSKGDAPNVLNQRWVTKDTSQGVAGTLRRHGGG